MPRCGTLERKVQRIVFLANEQLLETESQQALGHHFETLHLLHIFDGVSLDPQAASLSVVEMEITSKATCSTLPVGLQRANASFGKKGLPFLGHHQAIRPILLL
jgi:hypothetical protein